MIEVLIGLVKDVARLNAEYAKLQDIVRNIPKVSGDSAPSLQWGGLIANAVY